MPRPRIHDPDTVLDAAESLAVESGPSAVTIRAVAAATGVSNGAIYHTFGSRAELLGRTWLRAAQRFLAVQTDLVDDALGPVEAVVAAADAPAVFTAHYATSSKLLLTVRRSDLLGDDLPAEIASQLRDLDATLLDLMIRLSLRMWDRKDRHAVDVITTCIVDLPTSVLLRRDRLDNPTAREHLEAAVRAVLEIGPPQQHKGAQHAQPDLP
jgi:AcrR family transcriptional regulator